MGKIRFSHVFFAMMLALMLALVACGDKDENAGANADPNNDNNNNEENNNNDNNNNEEDDGLYSIDDFNNIKDNYGDDIDGGSLTWGLVSDTVFEGTLNPVFYSGAPDSDVISWFDEGMLTWDESFVYTEDGAATFEISEDNKTFTFTIGDDVNWHDGTPVTAADWEYAHLVIGHPLYDGDRYNATLRNVEGMEEYNESLEEEAKDADEGTMKVADDANISGIKVIDDKTLEITYKVAGPSLITGGVWTSALPKHIFEDLAVDEMSESDAVRKNPIGYGPYVVDVITPGESVTYTRYDEYWRGTPGLEAVTIKVIDPKVVVNELESGGVDVAEFPTDQYPDNVDMSNVEFLGVIDRAYTYIGFNLGTWDKDENEVIYAPEDSKVGDVELRKAMWHAVDNNAVGEQFYHGLRWAATTLIGPSHPEFHDETNPGRPYDTDLANEILDDAGYEWADGEDFRTNPDGSELVLNFASMSGGDTAEPIARYYLQEWEGIGINVELLDGQLHEFNSFYEHVGDGGDDNPDVDVFQGAWGTGINVDPSGLYGPEAMFNFSRFRNDKNDELLEKGNSEDAFDVDYRIEIYDEWQELMTDEIPVFPTLYRAALVAVNNRVNNYAIGDGTGVYRYEITVNNEEPHKDGEEPK